jgi:hypothetical protein
MLLFGWKRFFKADKIPDCVIPCTKHRWPKLKICLKGKMKKKPTKGVAEPEPGALAGNWKHGSHVFQGEKGVRQNAKCWKSASAGKRSYSHSLCR